MHLIHVQPTALGKQLPAGYSLPATSSSARQRYCRRYAPAKAPAMGTCLLYGHRYRQASGKSRLALHLHRAPPRWSRCSSPFVIHVPPAPVMRLHRSTPYLSYLFLLSPPPSLTCSSSSSQRRDPNLRITTDKIVFSFLHRLSPRLTAEEGLTTRSCKPPTPC